VTDGPCEGFNLRLFKRLSCSLIIIPEKNLESDLVTHSVGIKVNYRVSKLPCRQTGRIVAVIFCK
jgi:hypothetical protein